MNKILYFFACVYQSLKRKRPEGIPYFNLSLLTITMLFLHYVELRLVLRRHFMISFLPLSNKLFVIYLLSILAFWMYIFNLIIPLNIIRDMDVNEADAKRFYHITCLYTFLNIGILGYLMISKY